MARRLMATSGARPLATSVMVVCRVARNASVQIVFGFFLPWLDRQLRHVRPHALDGSTHQRIRAEVVYKGAHDGVSIRRGRTVAPTSRIISP